ncbi:GlsB/YeaQ/YmgE family stress response membrane protein [Sphingomonas flavalba]|uniref:GlsB/YeaQ/YmgE family stress response membrane protein n=1 Tax=Sphingomonas flavalba TaxID=2559804 RepID=UPI0039E0E78A
MEYVPVWIAIGLVIGVVGKLAMPGRDPGGFIVTILLGIAGALLAGFACRAADIGGDGGLAIHGAAAVGAAVLLILYRLVMWSRTR